MNRLKLSKLSEFLCSSGGELITLKTLTAGSISMEEPQTHDS